MPLRTSSWGHGPALSGVYRIAVPLLGLWLAAWIAISWPAIQDDALIHLRYADNLYRHHFITYDGIHPNYGASSLLYVGLLALLRGISGSADLPRAVSSAIHLLLFAGMAVAFGRYLPTTARVARLAALLLLVLVVVPSAVRWLDDGMETGLVVLVVTLLAWLLHGQAGCIDKGSSFGWRFFLLGLVSFLAVLLRTELSLLCGAGFLILALRWVGEAGSRRRFLAAMPTLAGAAAGLAVIVATMHVLLPDTAVAKSMGIGHWFNPIHDTSITLGGAFSFGVGGLLFWLLTLLLVAARRGRLTRTTALANCFFPVVLALSSLRGQQIQGVRYFAWTFFFSTTWNILELAAESRWEAQTRPEDPRLRIETWGTRSLYVFAGLLIVVLPFESVAMHRVLTRRAATVRTFKAQHLEVLRARRGMASDIGYIGYFSQAQICDLAGLVNGRAAARLTKLERAQACAAMNPDFAFLNASQLGPMARIMDLSRWEICGRYDFTNVTTPDTHYLAVRPEIADEVCGATGMRAVPVQTVLAGGGEPGL